MNDSGNYDILSLGSIVKRGLKLFAYALNKDTQDGISKMPNNIANYLSL